MPFTTGFTRLPPLLSPAATPNEALSTLGLSWARAVLHDTFSREVGAGGWGTPDVGTAWVVDGGTASYCYVMDGYASIAIAIAPTSVRLRPTTALGLVDFDMRFSWMVPQMPVGANAQVIPYIRWQDTNNHYRHTFNIGTDGAVTCFGYKVIGGSGTSVALYSGSATFIAAGGYTAGQWLRGRVIVVGDTHTLKLWRDGEPEPATGATYVDSSILVAGDVRLSAFTATGQTALPFIYAFDDLSIVNLAATGGAADVRFESHRIWRTANGVRELVAEPTDYTDPTTVDWEAPTGVPLTYEVTQYDGWQESIAAVVQSQVFDTPRWFLVIPGDPTLAFPMQWVRPGFTRTEGVRQSIRYPLGREDPIVISGPTQRPAGGAEVFTLRDLAQIERLRAAAKASRSGAYAVLKTVFGEALRVKIGTLGEVYAEAGQATISVPYTVVR